MRIGAYSDVWGLSNADFEFAILAALLLALAVRAMTQAHLAWVPGAPRHLPQICR